MKISNTTRGTILAERAEVARSFWARLVGLMGRRTLPEGGGLIIQPNGSIHTFWMRFAIDVIFVDRNDIVVGLREAMPPNRPYAGARHAYRTIELPTGAIRKSDTHRDDKLLFE